MGYDLLPRNKKSKGWDGNYALMDIICSFMEKAGVSKKILGKFDCNEGNYVKKNEALAIADKLERFLDENLVFIYAAGKLVVRTEKILMNIDKENRLAGWDGKERKDITVIKKGDELWQEIRNFIKFCRESSGFWVW